MAENLIVVRGPDWKWDDQDGGEGNTGTVLKVFRSNSTVGSRVHPAKTAVVRWRAGSANLYRAGAEGAYDLRILDNSDAGVKHIGVTCNTCDQKNIKGMRWQCIDCADVDLCTKCYMSDKHNLSHGFWRIQSLGATGVKVPKRENATKIKRKISSDSSGETLLLLLFKESLVDNASFYYRDHLPVLIPLPFDVGDEVKIDSDTQKVRSRQPGHGEWNDAMAEASGKVGKVVKVFPDGDLRVLVGGKLWTYNPASLTRVDDDDGADIGHFLGTLLSGILGRQVSVSSSRDDSETSVKTASEERKNDPECQSSSSVMEKLVVENKEMINDQNSDGDTPLHVAATCDNDVAARALLKHGADKNIVNNEGFTPLLLAVKNDSIVCVKLLLESGCDMDKCDSNGNSAFHIAINENNVKMVEILVAHRQTNFKLRNNLGYNVFHQAAHVGNCFAVEAIMRKSPSLVNEKNDEGNAALHLSVRGGHFKVTEMLLKKGDCAVDTFNKMKETPLLVAAKMSHCAEVELLVRWNADINAEDASGNTAVHLALLNQRSEEGIDMSDAPVCSRILSQIGQIPGIEKNCGLAISCFLIQKGASLEHKNDLGKTAMDYVISTPIRDLLYKFAGKKQNMEPKKFSQNREDNSIQSRAGAKPKQSIIKSECIVCSEVMELVTLKPCGHRIVCEECSGIMKKCIACQRVLIK